MRIQLNYFPGFGCDTDGLFRIAWNGKVEVKASR